ncbi:MAG: LolA-related protein [Candidatus Competibacteraceae bacterium]
MKTLLWLLLCIPVVTAAEQSWTLEQLMQTLATVKATDATFREQKQLAILQQPLVTAGTLRYRAPAYVRKQSLQPYQEIYEIDEDWLTIETPTEGRRQFYLPGYPLLRAFAEAIRGTLAGDLAALQQYYQVQLQGQATAWTLRLQPTRQEMAEHISAIVIQGRQERVLSVETLETGGDRSLMTVEPQTR